MDLIENILAQTADKVFKDMCSDKVMTRLRLLYADALVSASPNELDSVAADIVRYESDNMLSTMLILDSYGAPTVQRTLTDFSSVGFYFAQSRAESGEKHIIAKLMQKGFMDFAKTYRQEIESINGMKIISETLLDLNYAAGVSDNLSIRMRGILM